MKKPGRKPGFDCLCTRYNTGCQVPLFKRYAAWAKGGRTGTNGRAAGIIVGTTGTVDEEKYASGGNRGKGRVSKRAKPTTQRMCSHAAVKVGMLMFKRPHTIPASAPSRK